MKLKKIVLSLFFIHTGLTGLSLQAKITLVTAKVGGMVCVACTSVIDNHLKKIDGIKGVSNIDFKTGLVTIELTNDNTLTKETLKNKLNQALKTSTYEFEKIVTIK